MKREEMDSFPAQLNESLRGPQEPPGSPSKSSTAVTTPASPADTTEAYENICGICFTEVHPIDNPRGRLNSCSHLFCSYCIKEWAKSTNVCPSCKARFTRIYTIKADTQEEEETKVRRRNYKAWELTYSDEEDEEEWEDSAARHSTESQEHVVCAICQQSNNAARMIFCDRRQCPYAAHLDCLSLAERPVTFLCPSCTELREKEREGGADTATAVAESSSSAIPAQGVAAATRVAPAPNHLSRSATAHIPASARRAVPATAASAHSATQSARPAQSRRVTAPTSSGPASRSVAAPGHVSHALAGGSMTISSSSSSSSDSSGPTSRARSSAVPRRPVDFSKPHIPLMPSPTLSTTTTRRSDRRLTHPFSGGARGVEDDDDELYFLAPSSHAVAATIELERSKAAHAVEAQTRRQHDRMRRERLERAYGVRGGSHNTTIHNLASGLRLGDQSGHKRPSRTAAEEVSAEVEAAEKEFTDPRLRHAMEERMVRKWASDMLPVLRRRRYVEGDTASSEADMWTEATTQARKMVREKLDAKGAALRRRREQLVRAQTEREAAALAKLARIIAQHREREQQSAPQDPSLQTFTK